ncbi:hypothetical protein K402DRAFT_377483 [Aulographum hederae CBS 113979]|uniref:Uncharacterized protein n=1 Tax=Aulographum hederae CBS 113979 TaxID=1176131 RepID=A0A6G1GZV4_9PEZI|nr:hypothetical protein K402DRAFT_377483 [Aulographum hederae CBS 113979]
MSRALKQAIRDLFKDIKANSGLRKRILNRTPEGAGTRVYPPQQAKKDEKCGVRIDKGETVDGKTRLYVRISTNAERKSLRDLVRKNGSHMAYATTDIDPSQEATVENVNKVEEEFLDGVDQAMHSHDLRKGFVATLPGKAIYPGDIRE